MTFWGIEMKGNKPACYVPPPLGQGMSCALRLSQATLDIDAPNGVRVGVSCKTSSGDGEDDDTEVDKQQILICSLREGTQETCHLDLVFERYTEFTLKGSEDAVVHLAGYLVPDESNDTGEEDEGLDDEQLYSDDQLEELLRQRPDLLAQYKGSEDDSEEDSDSDAADSSEEEDDACEEDSEDEGPSPGNKKPSVIIEDVTDAQQEHRSSGKRTEMTKKLRVEICHTWCQKQKADEDALTEGMEVDVDLKDVDTSKKPAASQADPSPDTGKLADTEHPKSSERPSKVEESTQPERLTDPADDQKLEAHQLDNTADPQLANAAAKLKKFKKTLRAKTSDSRGIDVKTEQEEVLLEETDDDEGAAEEAEEAPEQDTQKAVNEGKKRKASEQPQQPAAKKITVEKKGKKEVKAEGQKAGKQEAKQESKQKSVTNGDAVGAANGAAKSKVRKYDNGFIIEELSMGDPAGKLAKAGKKVSVKYVGKLQKTGKVFDQTKGKPFQFRVGAGQVIKGWDQGVLGMRTGDKRRLTIPPQMAYGAGGVKNVIPGNATLVFDVELIDVKG